MTAEEWEVRWQQAESLGAERKEGGWWGEEEGTWTPWDSGCVRGMS